MPVRHREWHRTGHVGWLRAAVLGANDGMLSTASLVLGVAAAHGTRNNVLVAGVASLVAGAMSMAAGEYVSSHSQAEPNKPTLHVSARNSERTMRGRAMGRSGCERTCRLKGLWPDRTRRSEERGLPAKRARVSAARRPPSLSCTIQGIHRMGISRGHRLIFCKW